MNTSKLSKQDVKHHFVQFIISNDQLESAVGDQTDQASSVMESPVPNQQQFDYAEHARI